MVKEYYGEEIIGTPHHIDIWYDRSIRIYWVQVYDKNGGSLDLEYRNGMRHGFVVDAPNRTIAEREAKKLSDLLKIPYKFTKR